MVLSVTKQYQSLEQIHRAEQILQVRDGFTWPDRVTVTQPTGLPAMLYFLSCLASTYARTVYAYPRHAVNDTQGEQEP